MSTSTAVTPQGRINNVHDRVNALTLRANQPMVCSECSGTHFYVVRAEEFADNGYNSAQIRGISNNQDALYICICGTPVPLKDNAGGKGAESARARFLKSLQVAVEFRKKNSVQALAQGTVSITEHNEVKEQVVTLQEQVEWLMNAVEVLNSPSHADDEDAMDDDEQDGGDAKEIETEIASTTAAKTEQAPAVRKVRGPGKNKADTNAKTV